MKSLPRKDKKLVKGTKSLVELIILQAIEDIWHLFRKRQRMDFFNGEGFIDCADMLGLG